MTWVVSHGSDALGSYQHLDEETIESTSPEDLSTANILSQERVECTIRQGSINKEPGTYHRCASILRTHRAVILTLSLTLVVPSSAYFSASEIGSTLANQYGNILGSLYGGSP